MDDFVSRPAPTSRIMRLPSALLGRRIVRDGAWVAVGQVFSAVAALVSIRIMTELLAPEEFGKLTLLVGIAALALGLTANPRLQALIRYYPDAMREGRVGVLRATGLRLIWPLVALAVAVLAGAWVVAAPWLGGAWYTGLLVAMLFVTDFLRSLELSLFNAARRQRDASLIYVADAWSRPLMAAVAVLALGPNADAALAGYIAGSALVVLAMRAAMRLEGSFERHIHPAGDSPGMTDLASSIRRYALPLAPIAIFGWLSGMGDRYVIAGLLSLEDAGLYAAAYGLASRPFLMLGGVVELTMRPVLQNAVAAGNTPLIARAKATWLLIMAASAAFGVLSFVLLSDWLGHLLLAPQYRTATALMPWIALGYALYVVSNVFSRLCYVFDDTKAVLWLTVAGSMIGVLILVPAIGVGGLAGAAVATALRFGIEMALSVPLSMRAERRFFTPDKSSFP